MAGKRNKDDQRNRLVESYIKFIRIVLPEAIIFENVHGFTVNFHDAKGTKRYSSYVERELKKLGYKTEHRIIDISNFGIPQKRRRFILIAMRHHSPSDVFTKLEANKAAFCEAKGIGCSTSILEAISDLENSCGTLPSPDTKGFKAGVYGSIQSEYQRLMRDNCSPVGAVDSHRFVKHREEIIQLHKELLKTAPVGKRITPADNLVADLYRRGVTVLDASSQAPTVTSIPDELVHYKEPRILTVRELARIQSFPDWFEFKGKYTSGGKRRKLEVPRYTQVGNAVPPLFAEQIGAALWEVLSNDKQK